MYVLSPSSPGDEVLVDVVKVEVGFEEAVDAGDTAEEVYK